MNNVQNSLAIEFENLIVEIECSSTEALHLANLLFCDLPPVLPGNFPKTVKRYGILSSGAGSAWSLSAGKREIYHGASLYQLAYELVNEVLYHCIDANKSQHALHAGAVSTGDLGIIIPGNSGIGKSTFTALLCLNGCRYLTDELVFLAEDGKITPFTRPINLKTRRPIITEQFIEKHRNQIILSENGESIIPHRLLNSNFLAEQPVTTHIIFPEYCQGSEAKLTEISAGQSCFRLLQSHVNARNLPSHGVTSLSNITRSCRSYSLVYSDFDEIKSVLQSTFNHFF